MTDHLATGMKRMIRTVARSASLSDRLGEQSRLLRLTATIDTSARTAHNFNKMILCLTGFYFLQQFFCIFQSGNNRNFHIHTCYIVNSLFDSLDTTYIRKIKFCKFFAGQFFYCSTKSCF